MLSRYLVKWELPPVYAIAASLAIALAVTTIATIATYFSTTKTPDSEIYLLLAKNMIANFCYSLSPVETASCVPSWGEQPPGYPFFISLVRVVGGNGERPIIFAQMLLFSIAALNLCRVLYVSHRSPPLFILTTGAALFSPASFGWSHFVLTELLSSAAVMFAFAELARSVQIGRIRTVGICIAVICGMLVRWDLINLLVPVLAVLILSFGLRDAIRQGIPIVLICALPYLLLVARAAVIGLPLLPTTLMDEAKLPAGVLRFFRVAALDMDATVNLVWPMTGGLNYSDIQLKEDPECRAGMSHSSVPEYSELVNADELCTLFEQLSEVPDGQAVPASLDNQFSRIADAVSKNWFAANVEIPVLRAIRMWSRWLGHQLPYSEIGLTAPLKQIFISYYLLVGAGLLIACFAGGHFLMTIAIGALSFLVAKTAFLVSIPISAMEFRYLDPFFPTIDVIGLCGLARIPGTLKADVMLRNFWQARIWLVRKTGTTKLERAGPRTSSYLAVTQTA
jgi:hypothetical protein